MEILTELFRKKISSTSLDFVRSLESQINWDARLICIRGAPFYVGQTAAATKLNITASDTDGTGSVYSPLKTLDVAIKKIIASEDGTKDYKIFISGEVTGNSRLTPQVASKARSISICGLNGLDEQGNPKDALIGDGSDTVLNVMTSASLKDIVIKGGTKGLSVGLPGTTVTIESGVLITSCSRGVYIYGDGKLKMKGGKISRNTGGGGICNTSSSRAVVFKMFCRKCLK